MKDKKNTSEQRGDKNDKKDGTKTQGADTQKKQSSEGGQKSKK